MRARHACRMSCPNRLRRLSARSLSAAANRLLRSERAAAVVEMALVLPLFVALAMGILVYGQYFLLAHSVQQAANDGARAAAIGNRKRLGEGKRRSVRVARGWRPLL